MARRSKAKFQPKIKIPSSTAQQQVRGDAVRAAAPTVLTQTENIKKNKEVESPTTQTNHNDVEDWISSGKKRKKNAQAAATAVEKVVEPKKKKITHSDDENMLINDSGIESKNTSIENAESDITTDLKSSAKTEVLNVSSVIVNTDAKTKIKVKKSKMDSKKSNAIQKFKKLHKEHSESKEFKIDQNFISISDLIYYNPIKIGKELGMKKDEKAEETAETIVNLSDKENDANTKNEDTEKEEEPTVHAPQIRINEDGSIVIDEESLVIPSQQKETPNLANSNPVFENSSHDRVTVRSFSRRKYAKSTKWSIEETNKFYRCLSVVGTDFQLMHLMYKNFSEDALRRKYKREKKANPYRIDFALNQQHLNKWTEEMFDSEAQSESETIAESSTTILSEQECDVEETGIEEESLLQINTDEVTPLPINSEEDPPLQINTMSSTEIPAN